MVNRERGHTFLQLIIAMSVLTVLAGAALSGGSAHFATIGRAYGDLRMSQAATDRLEELTAEDTVLSPGERSFSTPDGMAGTERITEVRRGLYEIRVRVVRAGVPPVTLTTMAARGGVR